MNNIILQHKIAARKAIVNYELQLKKAQSSDEKLNLLKKIENERKFLAEVFDNLEDFVIKNHTYRHSDCEACQECIKIRAEMGQNLPGAPYEKLVAQPEDLPTLSDLWDILEKNVETEEAQLQADPAPSPTALERWALKSAVLDYYKNTTVDPTTPIVTGYGDDRATPQFAPNKESIYNIWCQKLYDLNRRKDRFNINDMVYKTNVEKGIPQGGAFEKQLDRYRDEFMNQLWIK